MRRVAVVFPLLLLMVSVANACSCMYPSFDDAFTRADVVFAGIATAFEDPSNDNASQSSCADVVYTFAVSRIWKGAVADSFEVHTARSSASCGAEFELGEHYLVYARQGYNGLSTTLCTRNNVIDSAAADLYRLPIPVYTNAAYVVPQPSPESYADDLVSRLRQDVPWSFYEEIVDAMRFSERIVPELIAVLEDPDRQNDRLAIKVLGSYGYKARAAIPVLLDFICNAEQDLRVAVAYTLDNICPEAIELYPEISGRWVSGDLTGCEEAIDRLQEMEFGEVPPARLAGKGGRTGMMYFVKRRVK